MCNVAIGLGSLTTAAFVLIGKALNAFLANAKYKCGTYRNQVTRYKSLCYFSMRRLGSRARFMASVNAAFLKASRSSEMMHFVQQEKRCGLKALFLPRLRIC